ncbi:transmembrane 9 superfamily member 3 [Rhizophagus clarus]|uniref:Transmembrane 9 superfamily member n=1 Tax=Rhizophagus clarus TaxID=94130 RepID=A0A8H3QAX7_9GLOM|nr:transmembrane 9 superfamily member 3 [Rhizophagus clarus]
MDYLKIIRLWFALLFILYTALVSADEHSHMYEKGEDIIIWVDTVGPRSNQQETYEYFQLPYCRGIHVSEHHHETLGEALLGMELVNSGIGMKFLINEKNATICEKELTAKDVNLFRYAVVNNYWYQMFLDDLPIWGFVGEVDNISGDVFLYTHREFEVKYNDDKIIQVKLESGNPVKLHFETQDIPVRFSYSVNWVATDDPFDTRFDKLLDTEFFEHKIHWFSIFNSFIMVIILAGFVSVILLRMLKKDYARYDKEESLGDLDHDLGDEYGWKQVHGDVFRAPRSLLLFSALVGTGHQLVWLTLVIILYTIIGNLYAERATILTASIFFYTLTSAVAGYTSASTYHVYGGRDWIKNVIVTATLWPGTISVITIIINSIAVYYSSSRAIPFTVMLAMFAIWSFLVFPLTLLGAILCRNWANQPSFPCRVNPIPRPIPEKVWYAESLVVIVLGGILPFASIFIEIYFIFSSFWAYKIYYVYGFMLFVFIILLIVTACVTIVSTYILLNSEDHRWHWMSFLTCGSTAVYVYLYSIYYFINRTKMYGLFQTSFYFGNTAIVCFGLFVMLGTVGYFAANKFVRTIYKNVKLD